LFQNGYHPIPTKGKMALVKGWPSQDFIDREMKPKRIESWPRRYPQLLSTGVRVDSGLVVIDGDVDDAELAEAAWQAIEKVAPVVGFTAPVRYGKSAHKFALFARLDGTPFRYEASHGYVRSLELALWQSALLEAKKGERVPEPTTHRVEIFGSYKGGPCSQHFGIRGPHSYAEDGSVAASYSWGEGPTLEDTALADLPVITHEQVVEILVAFERLAAKAGWVPLTEPIGSSSTVAYDITEATRFDTNRGEDQIDYEELCASFAVHGSSLRCSASFIPGRGDAGDRSHCAVGDQNRHGCVGVYVFGDAVTHFPAELAPRPDLIADEIERLREELGPDLEGGEKTGGIFHPRPADGLSVARKALWLVDNYGYNALSDSVVELHKRYDACTLKPVAFARLYRAWREEVTGPKGGKSWSYATAYWEVDPKRLDIEAVRMRPDRPFPTYVENGLTYKKTYLAPDHATKRPLNVAELNGPFVAFMERFVPDPIERAWLLDWMAHKQAYPEIPGTAVIFVADTEDGTREGTFGTGRGLLFKVVHRLYGEQYARSQSFSILEGSSGQSVFNDWMHGSILVTVDEAKTSPTAHRRGEKSATYEVLKDLVDPAPKRHTFNGKYKVTFDGMSYCSFWVASNHADALAIPENDRRFTVLRNGRAITPEEAKAFAAWSDDPASIAALSASLAARDLTGFNMYEPLETAGKAEMAEMALSDVENLLRDMAEDAELGKAFTKQHLEQAIEHNYGGQGSYWRGEFRGAWARYCAAVRTSAGGQKKVRVFGKQKKVFCFRSSRAAVEHMPDAALRREVAKWGGVDLDTVLSTHSGLSTKDE
jgi:hypothetical protein